MITGKSKLNIRTITAKANEFTRKCLAKNPGYAMQSIVKPMSEKTNKRGIIAELNNLLRY